MLSNKSLMSNCDNDNHNTTSFKELSQRSFAKDAAHKFNPKSEGVWSIDNAPTPEEFAFLRATITLHDIKKGLNYMINKINQIIKDQGLKFKTETISQDMLDDRATHYWITTINKGKHNGTRVKSFNSRHKK